MNKLYCLACPTGCLLTIAGSGIDMIVDGGKCDQGLEFAKAELTEPVRTLTTTVRTVFPDVPVISVRTAGDIPKDDIQKAIEAIDDIVLDRELGVGEVLIENVAETGVSVIITSPALMQMGAELENKNAELNRAGGSTDETSAAPPGEGEDGESPSNLTGTVLDEMGEDYVGGVVGAAGEAVGVEDADEDGEDTEDSTNYGDPERKEGYRTRSRARISKQ